MSDGKLIFNTKIDNSDVPKDLKDLERQIKRSQESISKLQNAKLPLVKQAEELGAKLDTAQAKLERLKNQMAEIDKAMSPGSSPEEYLNAYSSRAQVEAEIKSSEKEVADLQKQWDTVNDKIDDCTAKIKQNEAAIQESTIAAQTFGTQIVPNGTKMSAAMEKAEKSANRFGKRLSSLVASALVFNLISSGLRSMVSYMGTALKSNSEYTAQLAQLKGAWLTAFQPIYDFVLPGLLAIMRVLTAIGNALASVLSFFGGKTATQSAKNAKALNKQASAIGDVGDAAEEASKQLMGFDEINRLESTETNTGVGGGGGDAGTIQPDFSGITDMEDDLLKILGIVTAIAAGLLTWKIASMFTDSLSMAAGLALAVAGAFLYGFNWADAFINGLDWENLAGLLGGMLLVVGGLALAFGTTGAAIGLLVTGIGLVVLALHEWITTGTLSNEACTALVIGILAIGAALALFTGSWIPALLAAIIAFVVAAVTKGDEIKAVFASVIDWLKGIFQRDWTEIFGEGLGSVLNSFFQTCSEYLDSIQQVFNGLIDFIQGVFTGNWEQALDGLAGIAKGAVNGVISVLNGLIRAATDGINALFRLLSVNIALPGGGSIGWELPQFTAPQIPYLAQGAVLPANRPFMAVVGDQRNGTNIEAPLETIKQALAEVMAQNGGGDITINFTGDLAQLARVLTPEVTRQQRRADRAKGV